MVLSLWSPFSKMDLVHLMIYMLICLSNQCHESYITYSSPFLQLHFDRNIHMLFLFSILCYSKLFAFPQHDTKVKLTNITLIFTIQLFFIFGYHNSIHLYHPEWFINLYILSRNVMGNNMSLMAEYSYLFQTWVSKAVFDFFAQSSASLACWSLRVAFSVKAEVFNCSPRHRRMCTQVF